MSCRSLCAVLLFFFFFVAACGKSSTSPTPVPSISSLAAEAAIKSAMTQAMSEAALVGRLAANGPTTVTVPCSGGGSIVMTRNPLPEQLTSTFRSSSRIEFRDCRNETVTINGDPYLETSMDLLPSTGGGDSVMTMQTIGGVRINSNGTQGRVQFNCTTNASIGIVPGSPPHLSMSSSGTITFEQPLGSTPVVRPCGPA